MGEEKLFTIVDARRALAAEAFNKAWDYIDMEERSTEDTDAMLAAAFAQRYLWGTVGSALEIERAEWQLSRVYAVLGSGTECLRHAERCLHIVEENDIKDFDLAFGHEAVARAHKVLGNEPEMREHRDKALAAAENVADKGDKEYTLSEIKSI
jgi:hypothetical protein